MAEAEWKLTIDGFEVDGTARDENGWQIELHSISRSAACPCCGQTSKHGHSYYKRRIRDVPVEVQPVELVLHVRRFECRNEECTRKVFCERLTGFAAKNGQRSERLTHMLRTIGFALNGEGGARLAHELGVRVSGDTIIRVVRSTPDTHVATPEVLGVDDWAIHRGVTYGTLLLDHETRRPIDLVEGRTAEALANWLRAHPGVRVVTRDRSTEYARGIADGAPNAQHVADRWHLLHNLREAVQRCLVRIRGELEQVWLKSQLAQTAEIPAFACLNPLRSAPERAARQISRGQREARYIQAKALQSAGCNISQLAHLLDISRGTARKYFSADTFPEHKMHRRHKSILDPFVSHLQRRFDEGCRNAMQVWREIKAQGFSGTFRQVNRWMRLRRENPAATAPHNPVTDDLRRQAAHRLNDLPSARALAWLIVRRPNDLTAEDQNCLSVLLTNAKMAQLHALAQDFGQLIREHEHAKLDVWLADSAGCGFSELMTFAKGLRADYSAVKAALTTQWSNGPTEGHVNRLKMIKRLMFGRAKFDLLRIRVLHPS